MIKTTQFNFSFSQNSGREATLALKT